MALFTDRFDAGRQLAALLTRFAGKPGVVVVGIPRGGLQTALPIAQALCAPLVPWFAKKITLPDQPEVAIGAVALGGGFTLDDSSRRLGVVTPEYVAHERERIGAWLQTRFTQFTGFARLPSVAGKIVIVVDDGVATGQTLLASIQSLRKLNAKTIVVAVPVGNPFNTSVLRQHADVVVCLHEPEWLTAVGQAYDSFPQVEDDEANVLLDQAKKRAAEH